MAAQPLPLIPSHLSIYEKWSEYFLSNRTAPAALHFIPWEDETNLSEPERLLVGEAIQQFQLGEFARGRGLMRRASTHPGFAGDIGFEPAMKLFIAEEQGHSAMLGRFLDREGIPRIERDWVDGLFRKVRKLAGLELCVMVLVSAELLAIPFYQALRDATSSKVLRAICRRILFDEVSHLRFQAQTLGIIRRGLTNRSRRAREAAHAALMAGAALVLWMQHSKVFRAAKWDFDSYWKCAWREFARLTEESAGIAERPREENSWRLD
jgi:hypothetical protein